MYQDEAGFGRISKLGTCWSPKNYRPNISSHHIRECRYCYGAADAHTGESFFIIEGVKISECLKYLRIDSGKSKDYFR